MKKSTAITIVVVLSALLVFSFVPRMVQYFAPVPEASDSTSEENSEPTYTRVEAERYEIQFPHFVNGEFCYGGLYCGQFEMEGMALISSFISLADADCIYNEIFYLSLYVYVDGSAMQEHTLDLEVEQGEYGRYVISETQVADEPVAYTLEPIYEYVLVE